jgi:hypothetical protein
MLLAPMMPVMLVLLVQIGFAGSAHAQAQRRMVVFPLESSLTDEQHADVPDELAKVLARESQKRDMKVTTAQASFSETALITGCDPEDASCHQTILEQIGADHAILGTVEPGDDGRVRISLVHISRHVPPVQQTIEIEAAQADEQLTAALPPLFGDSASGEGDVVVTPPTTGGGGGSSLEFGRVKHSSWALLGGGAAVMITGTVLWGLASRNQTQIDDLPLVTLQDFDKLRSLERSAKRKATFGNISFVAGLAAASVGAWLAYRQAKVSTESSIMVTPTPMEDGMGVTLTVGWPQ